MITWLKWFFSNSGIQYTTTKPYQFRFRGKDLLWLNRHLGVGYLPNGPTAQELTIWATMEKVLHRTFRPYTCTICGTHVWSYKPVKVCESYKCFKANYGKWK